MSLIQVGLLFRNNPLNLALESFKTDINLIKKLPSIFNVPLMKIIEYVSDELVEKRNVKDALDLCNNFKVRIESIHFMNVNFFLSKPNFWLLFSVLFWENDNKIS